MYRQAETFIAPSAEDVAVVDTAENIEEQKEERFAPFAFSLCQIPIGATINYCNRVDEKSGLTCTKYNAEKNSECNKVKKINEQWVKLKEEAYASTQSEEGALKRQARLIWAEGRLGYIIENEDFRRFKKMKKSRDCSYRGLWRNK